MNENLNLVEYDIIGKKLKAYLSRIFLTKGGKLKIFTELPPTFSPSDDTIKKVQKKQVKNNYPVAHKYYFRMYTIGIIMKAIFILKIKSN